MTDEKITDLASQTGASVASTDLYETVDVSDASMAATGTNKKITAVEQATAVAALLPAGSVGNAALTTNPLARANHTGTQLAATVSDFDTQVATTAFLKTAAGASVANAGNINSNVNTVASSGSTQTLDTTTYAVHDITMSAGCTFTFSNPIASGKNTTFVLILRGAFTPTLPASVKWSGGSVPTYTTPSVYVFTTVDGGTTWYATQTGKAFA